MGFVRVFLDRLYLASGLLGALCLLAMLLIIVAQMVSRWMGVPFPGSTQYAGYCMAASSFLAFSYALNRGAHIRVSLFLNALGEHKFWGELWCLLIASAASCYLAFYAIHGVQLSLKFNDISQGQDATPLWIPQSVVAFGAVLLAVCFVDNLITLILTRRDNIRGDVIGAGE
ncbi:MAG: ABC transporter substrate-binding protein [Hyphomicrobiales bacterium]|nr:TRAP transporter small permease [Hyphomicrobiales bacterium]PCJ83295.1 MAG: ABC transporter substrate-binding protein [Hyphomicrobiales bacterium]